MPTPETLLKGMTLLLAAVAVLAVAGGLHRVPQKDPLPSSLDTEDPVRQTLRRCRSLSPQELETDTACQAAWAENRRRFFGISPDAQDAE